MIQPLLSWFFRGHPLMILSVTSNSESDQYCSFHKDVSAAFRSDRIIIHDNKAWSSPVDISSGHIIDIIGIDTHISAISCRHVTAHIFLIVASQSSYDQLTVIFSFCLIRVLPERAAEAFSSYVSSRWVWKGDDGSHCVTVVSLLIPGLLCSFDGKD